VERHDQAFVGRHGCRFLDALSLDREDIIRLERIYEVNSLRQNIAGHSSEQRQHSNMSGRHSCDGCKEQDHDDECQNEEANSSQEPGGIRWCDYFYFFISEAVIHMLSPRATLVAPSLFGF